MGSFESAFLAQLRSGRFWLAVLGGIVFTIIMLALFAAIGMIL